MRVVSFKREFVYRPKGFLGLFKGTKYDIEGNTYNKAGVSLNVYRTNGRDMISATGDTMAQAIEELIATLDKTDPVHMDAKKNLEAIGMEI